MKDEVFNRYNYCPKCGKSKGLYYIVQYPLMVRRQLNNKPFITTDDNKRDVNLTNKKKAAIYDVAKDSKFQKAICRCDYCSWESDIIYPTEHRKSMEKL